MSCFSWHRKRPLRGPMSLRLAPSLQLQERDVCQRMLPEEGCLRKERRFHQNLRRPVPAIVTTTNQDSRGFDPRTLFCLWSFFVWRASKYSTRHARIFLISYFEASHRANEALHLYSIAFKTNELYIEWTRASTLLFGQAIKDITK